MWEEIQRYIGVTADGTPGPKTGHGIAEKIGLPSGDWKNIQRAVGVSADGIPGNNTARAIMLRLGIWPKEKDVRTFFGNAGENLTIIDLPYPMRLAWSHGQTVSRITCHKYVAEPLKRILKNTLEHYGYERIVKLGLDLFGGCFNDRDKVGGTTKSMHAYGIAVDLDPDRNQLKWGRNKAAFAKSDYDAFWSYVEAEGGYSLGRKKNYDWMHFQFAQL